MVSKAIAFRSNPNKDFLRTGLDRSLVEAWSKSRSSGLKYLGLPGSEMLDIVEWQGYLAHFTTIERLENQQHLMFLKANVTDVEHRLHSLYGEFDRVLLEGRDQYGQSPRWPYDVVNLDFFGGLLYSNLTRPEAIKKLIHNQSGFRRSFLMFITHDLRDADKGQEKVAFMQELRKLLSRDYPGKCADESVFE